MAESRLSYSTNDCDEGMSKVTLSDEKDQQHDQKHKVLKRISKSCAFFKSQQRNDPDLTEEEKFIIAEDILSKSKSLFLERFWKHLELEDILYFRPYSNEYTVDFYLKEIQKSKTSNSDVNRIKNRRYKAMQQLLSDGEYFSEDEMKYRDPFLYEQMVGQYLTDDSLGAKVDKTDLRFSTILLKHIDIIQEHSVYDQQKETEEGQTEENESDDEESEMEEDDDEVPRKKIPDTQKAYFKQEFLTIMQERFMSGQDEQFDYSEVDNNIDYDDLEILQNDEEEKYFDHEDDQQGIKSDPLYKPSTKDYVISNGGISTEDMTDVLSDNSIRT